LDTLGAKSGASSITLSRIKSGGGLEKDTASNNLWSKLVLNSKGVWARVRVFAIVNRLNESYDAHISAI
jgi:hypothetical protein